MSKLFNDPIVEEKHRIQRKILKEVNGDLRKYSEIAKKEAEELRKKYPGKFTKVRSETSFSH